MDPKKGQVWQCKQDSRGVVVLNVWLGSIEIQAMGSERKTLVKDGQFARRYRYIAASVQADMEGE